jgi:aminopeptidase N
MVEIKQPLHFFIHKKFITMKKNILILLAFLILAWPTVMGQNHHCQHRVSFEKSSLGDSLDALTYHVIIDSINWSTDNLYARTQISLKSKVDNLSVVSLELMNLQVDEVLVNGENNTNFSQTNLRLNIPLSSPLNTNETAELWISFHGVPFHENWGGFYIDNQYAYNLGVGFDANPHNLGKSWFPCIDDFHDRAVYDVTARVNEAHTAVAGGLIQEIIEHGDGTKSYHWHLENSIPTYLASVAIGTYSLYEDTYEGIETNIPIKIYARPANVNQVEASFVHLKEILSHFEIHFGAYPFERVGYVGTAIGAMEHATNVAYPNFAFDGYLTYEDLYAHELSHMWFGDKVTCASAEDMWLNEGWATFCQIFYEEAVYGSDDYKESMMENLREVLRMTHFTDGGYLALYGIPHNYTYGSTVYDKGATVVQSLRGYLGEDVFFPAIKEYLANYAYNYASSANMRDFLTGYTGINMTPFFDTYVFEPGFSHFSVDSIRYISGNDYEIYLRQKMKGRETFAAGNKVDVTLFGSRWQRHDVRVAFDGETGSGVFALPFEPIAAIVDYDRNFSDAVTDLGLTITESGEYNFANTYFELEVESMTDSALVHVSHHWVAPDPLKTPLEGLTLSDYRYYSIDGIIPPDFTATGVFRYTMSGKLDHTLLGNSTDSLVILYRPNAQSDWQGIPYEMDGSPFVGYLRVPNIRKGEYTPAVWDGQYVHVKNPVALSSDDYMQIYPNPSSGRVHFDLMMPENGQIEIFDSLGKKVDSLGIQAHQHTATWDARRSPKGTYIARLLNEDSVLLSSQRIVIQ